MTLSNNDLPEQFSPLIFNHYPQIPESAYPTGFFSDNFPARLDVYPQRSESVKYPNRHERQQKLREHQESRQLTLEPDEVSLFGLSLDWRHRFYTLSVSSDPSLGELKTSIREGLVLGVPGEIDQLKAGGILPDQVATGDRPSRTIPYQKWRNQHSISAVLSDEASKRNICLFNVVVALEWNPSERYLQQLEWAFREASDFLYDVTDGYMAFGQVVFVGSNYLDCADIQIAASNRYLPRSVVSGLHQPDKYRPIRVGRGCWQKNRRVTLPWDAPESYRTLVHEWAHYALSLKDLYILPQSVHTGGENELAVPGINLPVESIMYTLEGTSELTAKITQANTQPAEVRGKLPSVDEWETLRTNFSELGIDEGHQPQEGGKRLSLPLPHFRRQKGLVATPLVVRFVNDGYIDQADTLKKLKLQHCWVFLLRGKGDTQKLIPQGSPEQHRDGEYLELFGAEEKDIVIIIGEEKDASKLMVRCGTISGQPKVLSSTLNDVTPDSVLVDVVPGKAISDQCLAANISVHAHTSASEIWLFTLEGGARKVQDQEEVETTSLDGHVLLRWVDPNSQKETLTICNYSQGGSPPNSGFPVTPNPITAGSSDGNALLFFYDKTLFEEANTPSNSSDGLRIVTTRLHGSPGGTMVTTLRGKELEGYPRSYTFSIASNQKLDPQLLPTLVMFFDKNTKNGLESNKLLTICRYTDKGWKEINTPLQEDPYMLAIPLNESTASQLIKSEAIDSRFERYRVFALPA